MSAYEAFFDPLALWVVLETVVCARLTDLDRDLAFAVVGAKDGVLDVSSIDSLKVRFDAILE